MAHVRIKTVRFDPYPETTEGRYAASELMKGLMLTYGCFFKRVEDPVTGDVHWQACYL